MWGGDPEVDDSPMVTASVNLGQFALCAGEADVQSFDLTEPALALGLRVPTDEEWTEFLGHSERRKVSVGTCGRSFSTPCIHDRPGAGIAVEVVEGPQHRLAVRTHRRRVRLPAGSPPASLVRAPPVPTGRLPSDLQPAGEVPGLDALGAIPRHVDSPKEAVPAQQVHLVGTSRCRWPPCRLQVPQEGSDSLDRRPRWTDEPVGLPRIVRGHQLADQGHRQAGQVSR